MKVNAELEAFLAKHIQQMLVCFCLTQFEVTLKRFGSMDATFDILVDYEYMDAVIRYGERVERAWEQGKKEDILKALTHEVTHILTGIITDEMKMTRLLIKAEEQSTELISRLLYRLYKEKHNEEAQ